MTADTNATRDAVQGEPLDEALNLWRDELDADDDDLACARQVCQDSGYPGLDTATLGRAVGLVVETWPTDPDTWPRESSMLSPAEHLAMMIAGIGAELIAGPPGHGRKLWRAYLHGPYTDERVAAFHAVERVGGLDYLDELSPADRQRETIPDRLLDQARGIADNIGDAPQWVEVDDIGWVVFSQASFLAAQLR
jgi:hypothetical protein